MPEIRFFCVCYQTCMENREFMLLSDEAKKDKLRDALRSKTGDSLPDYALDAIIAAVPIDRQYEISVYGNEKEFPNALPENAIRGVIPLPEERSVTNKNIAFYREENTDDKLCTLRIFIS